MKPIKSVLITGANAGLGREAARQLALRKGMDKIYLACRNADKAEAAKAALEAETGKTIFEILLMDVSSPSSVRQAVSSLTSPVDAVILNAGGTGGRTPNELTNEGVTHIFASNVLGHVVLVDELLERHEASLKWASPNQTCNPLRRMNMSLSQMGPSSDRMPTR